MNDLYNENNIITELKYKEKVKNTIFNLVVFFTFAIAYIFVYSVESKKDSIAFFVLGFCYSLISFVNILLIKSRRDDSLKLFKFGLLGYSAFTLMFDFILKFSIGANIEGTLKTLGTFTRIMIPVGLMVWQGKEIFLFAKGHRSKNDEIDNLKEHGNDGFH